SAGARAQVSASARWLVTGADDALNAALGVSPPADLAVAAVLPVERGATDDIATAAGRAAEDLWAHERLLELAVPGQSSLDQAPREKVLSRPAPARATTLLDYERIALEVPGTTVRRARAWSGIDPRYPCLQAPGTVSVVVVPELPLARPEPTPELLETVRRYLHRRRTIGTRLVVVGPEYVEVRVRANVRALPRADAARTQEDILAALAHFLHPMLGGPTGRGWPFGRDVYRSEVLHVIDSVSGVDHVLELELYAGQDEVPCGNVCVGPFSLTTSGTHEVEVS
ncbi:MAG TPA: baseplate J/gp47 family protein, partial [Tepidiformaceae bacterium]